MQFVGIDIAKASFDIALLLPGNKYRTKAKMANSPKGHEEFLAWHAKHAPEAAVGMEATGVYHQALATGGERNYGVCSQSGSSEVLR